MPRTVCFVCQLEKASPDETFAGAIHRKGRGVKDRHREGGGQRGGEDEAGVGVRDSVGHLNETTSTKYEDHESRLPTGVELPARSTGYVFPQCRTQHWG
jgi:hypothetical protein